MKPSSRTTRGLLLIIFLAFVGFLLVYLPQQLVSQYQLVRDAGGVWVAVYFSVVGTGAALLLICTGWIVVRLLWRTRRKAARREQRAKSPSQLTAEEKQRELDENLASIEQYQDDAAEVQSQLASLASELGAKREQQKLEIVAFGTVSSGKSSLLNALAGRDVFATDARAGTTLQRNEIPWPGADRVMLVDTPGLGEIDGAEHGEVSAEAARDADLILLVVDGPLRDSEFQLLRRLGQMEKRVLLCLNKADWYTNNERESLIGQLTGQTKELVDPADIVAVRSRPAMRPQMHVSADGQQEEQTVEVAPDISELGARMLEVIRRDGPDLLLANLLLQSRGLVEEARAQVRQALDRRAWELVDRYMWGAGGAAALSPLPVLDLAAGSAVSVKMVLDLARVYHQEVDLHVVVNLLGQLSKNLLGILGASAATPAVTAAVASLLKTVPGIGTIAGGVLQGLVQALITRWIGAVFIAYFQNEMQQPEGGLASLARREWQRVTTAAELRKLLQSARHRGQLTSTDAEDSKT